MPVKQAGRVLEDKQTMAIIKGIIIYIILCAIVSVACDIWEEIWHGRD